MRVRAWSLWWLISGWMTLLRIKSLGINKDKQKLKLTLKGLNRKNSRWVRILIGREPKRTNGWKIKSKWFSLRNIWETEKKRKLWKTMKLISRHKKKRRDWKIIKITSGISIIDSLMLSYLIKCMNMNRNMWCLESRKSCKKNRKLWSHSKRLRKLNGIEKWKISSIKEM